MDAFLAWLEASAFGHAIRESGVWAYAVINLAHILGIATLFGSILVLDLRLVGLWRRLPLAPLATAAVPVATTGLALAIVTGLGMLATNGSEYIGNPYLLIKFPAIAAGLLNVLVLSRTTAWRARGSRELTDGERRQLALLGGISLLSWTTAITAGRMIAYW